MTHAYAEELLITLKRAGSVLKATGVPFALGGGFAAYAHGGVSSDHDVDFLIRHEDLDTILPALANAGFRIEQPPEDWLVKAWDGDQLVDLIYRPIDIQVTHETLKETTMMPVGPIHLPVLSVTELMVHKLLTLSQHRCDFAPALQLARSLREKIDWDRLGKETEPSPYAGAFIFLAERLELAPRAA
jgi:hypothetical protein